MQRVVIGTRKEGQVVDIVEFVIFMDGKYLAFACYTIHINFVMMICWENFIVSNKCEILLNYSQLPKLKVLSLVVPILNVRLRKNLPLDLNHWPFWMLRIPSFWNDFDEFTNYCCVFGLSKQQCLSNCVNRVLEAKLSILLFLCRYTHFISYSCLPVPFACCC